MPAKDANVQFDADDEDSDFEPRASHSVLDIFNNRIFVLVVMHDEFFDVLYQDLTTRRYFENKRFILRLISIRNHYGKFTGKMPENHRLMLIHAVRVAMKALSREVREAMMASLSGGVHGLKIACH